MYTRNLCDNTACSHGPLQLWDHRQLLGVSGAAGEDQPAQVSVCVGREGSLVHGLLRSQRQYWGMFIEGRSVAAKDVGTLLSMEWKNLSLDSLGAVVVEKSRGRHTTSSWSPP